MHIIAKRTLKQFWQVHPQAEVPLQTWFGLVSKAVWNGPADVKAMFGNSIDFVGDNRIVFDIAGNKYRLIVHVAYRHGKVLVKFLGTHTEYDRINANTV